MTHHEEIAILIERYLDNELSEQELAVVKSRLESDVAFKRELNLHIRLRQNFQKAILNRELKRKMNAYHLEFEPKSTQKIIKRKQAYSMRRILFAAASVSLLVSCSALLVYFMINQQQKKIAQIQFLNRVSEQPVEEAKSEENPTAAEILPETANVATAFMIADNGYMLTNYHVVAGKKYVHVEKYQDSVTDYIAKVILVDRRLDIALLKITDPSYVQKQSIPYTLSNQSALIGQKVFTLGYPKNDIVYSEGPVSSLTGFHSDTVSLQLSLPVNPGNSGAPVFNDNGELVGIISGKNTEADGEAYGIKAELIGDFLTKVKDTGMVLPKRNLLKNKKVTDQVKILQSFIYIIKA